uniref:hypothetical protein n=1 Tax=Algoriphagus sp. TaxID=1872435 RepID=UPI0025F9AAAF
KRKTGIQFVILLLIFLNPDLGVAQEKLPSEAVKLEIVLPRAIWGSKSKITITDYAKVIAKEGIISSKIKEIEGVGFSESKNNLKISLMVSEIEFAELEGQAFSYVDYGVESNNMLNRFLDLGIESETITRMAFLPRVNKGTIKISTDSSATWDMKFNIPVEQIREDFLVGYLTNGTRSIKVIQTNLDYLLNQNDPIYINDGFDFYEFVEDGISIGAVTFEAENSIWLKPGIDSYTQMVLCTAMMALAF